MTLKERIDEILSLKKDQCWYITKQKLTFEKLCIAANILEKYKNNRPDLNFEKFFNKEIIDNLYDIPSNHRFTNNCKYVGLLGSEHKQYVNNDLTEAYYNIKNLCMGDFSKTDLYNNEKIDQIEKLVIAHQVDERRDGLRDGYKLHPVIYLYKILISIGDLTGKYLINFDEFKKFVGTSKNYFYFTTTIDLILESRRANSPYKDDFAKINKNLFDGNRFNLLFSNLPYLHINRKSISLNSSSLLVVRSKIDYYEKKYSKKFDEWQSVDFQNSSKSIFNFY